MDFLVVYSDYSEACRKLFEIYPKLKETKGLCADCGFIRKCLIDDVKVSAVPTLLVTDNEKILQRIVGAEGIKNWLWIISNDINQVSDPPENAVFEDELMPPKEAGQTILDVQPEIPQLKKPHSLKNAAEEMQREREIFLNAKPQT